MRILAACFWVKSSQNVSCVLVLLCNCPFVGYLGEITGLKLLLWPRTEPSLGSFIAMFAF